MSGKNKQRTNEGVNKIKNQILNNFQENDNNILVCFHSFIICIPTTIL